MPENLTILITGASRAGIGKGLAAAYLAAPGNTVIASVRDPVHPNLQALRNLPCGPRSSLVIAQIDSGNERSIQDAIQNLQAPRLDVVISNAGVNESFDRLVDTTTSILDKHIHVNAYGPLWLFQQTLPLLSKSSAPRFVVVSSGAGSTSILDQMEEQPMGPMVRGNRYGEECSRTYANPRVHHHRGKRRGDHENGTGSLGSALESGSETEHHHPPDHQEAEYLKYLIISSNSPCSSPSDSYYDSLLKLYSASSAAGRQTAYTRRGFMVQKGCSDRD
ncbi:Short-chain dehydrogenase/reductase SDR [Ilyonectria robusta]